MKVRRWSPFLYATILGPAWLLRLTVLAGAEPLECVPEFVSASGFSLSESESYVIRDLNGDGRDDFVTFTEPVRVYLSEPGRTFRTIAAPVDAVTGAGDVGDFNGDGAPDLAVGYAYQASPECGGNFKGIAILYGSTQTGVWDETFRSPVPVEIPGWAAEMTARDLDGDGADDLLVVTECWSRGNQVRVAVYFGQKGVAGPFSRSFIRQGRNLSSYPVDLGVRFGDLDGNGLLDVVVCQPSLSGLIDVYFGALDQRMYILEAPVTVEARLNYVRYLDVTDANGDGIDDVFLWDHYLPTGAYEGGPFSLTVSGKCLLGSAGRDFPGYDGPWPVLSSPQGRLGDVDGDRTDDLIWLETGLLRFFLGSEDSATGEVSFHHVVPDYLAGLFPKSVEMADFDGDGLRDFAVQGFVWDGWPAEQGFWVLYGDGVSQGSAPRIHAMEALGTPRPPMALLARDFNGDALADIAFATPQFYRYDPELEDYIVLPACYGVFLRNPPAAGPSFSGPSFHDFGAPPYGLTKEDFCRQYGDAELHDEGGICDPGYYTAIKAEADVNSDGIKDDVMISNNSTCNTCTRVTEVLVRLEGVYRADAEQFMLPPIPPTHVPIEPLPPVLDWALMAADGTKGLVAADFNGDGWDDLAVAGFHGSSITVLYNRAPCRGYVAYLRADANGDRDIDVSDAVKTLLHLFVGAEAQCPAAMDVNGDGRVNVADPVSLLQYLFMDGAGPAGGFPLREAHRPEDPLSCSQTG